MKDSIDKIITIYFSCVTREEFEYKGKIYKPKDLKVSTLLFRDLICPENCGGCCHQYTTDYLPEEQKPNILLVDRKIELSKNIFKIYSDLDISNNYYCKYIDTSDGRCMIHENRPFSCDFELIRFLMFSDDSRPNVLTNKNYGRGWNMKRIDGNKGALCKIIPETSESRIDTVRKLMRLLDWCKYFNLKNKVDDIINWAIDGKESKIF
jgi:hypothetical protein